MFNFKKVKSIVQIFLIIGIVFSLGAVDTSKKSKGQFGGAATTVGKDVANKMPYSPKRKIGLHWDKDGGRIGFHLKEDGKFSIPFVVLTGYTKKSGKANTPNGTYEGSESCEYGGSMSLKNFQISDYKTDNEVQHGISMETVEYNVTGNIIFRDCEDEATDYFDEDGKPDLYEEISNGTMYISGYQEVGFDIGGGGKGETNISEMHLQAKNFRYNDDVFDMDISTETDLYEEELDPVSDKKGGFYINVTLDGSIKVTGTINGEDFAESHKFDNQLVRNHFIKCDKDKPKTWRKCTSVVE